MVTWSKFRHSTASKAMWSPLAIFSANFQQAKSEQKSDLLNGHIIHLTAVILLTTLVKKKVHKIGHNSFTHFAEILVPILVVRLSCTETIQTDLSVLIDREKRNIKHHPVLLLCVIFVLKVPPCAQNKKLKCDLYQNIKIWKYSLVKDTSQIYACWYLTAHTTNVNTLTSRSVENYPTYQDA